MKSEDCKGALLLMVLSVFLQCGSKFILKEYEYGGRKFPGKAFFCNLIYVEMKYCSVLDLN